MSITRGLLSIASRYCGNVSQAHSMPADMAIAGISSTASIRSISQSRSLGCTGAKPTPQLPITTVVTPFQQEGVRNGSHATCASKWVCMSIQPGVTSLPAASISRRAGPDVRPDGCDLAAVDPDVALKLRSAAAVDDAAVANRYVVHGCSPARRLGCRRRPAKLVRR